MTGEIEMTPCEKLGYKVGDEFEVVRYRHPSRLSIGSRVTLKRDDGTHEPFFTDEEGNSRCIGLNDFEDEVRPVSSATIRNDIPYVRVDEVTSPGLTMHLTDQLKAARNVLAAAQEKYDAVLAEHQAAYPWLHGELVKDLPPEEWRAGDLVEWLGSSKGHYTKGLKYTVERVGEGFVRLSDDDTGDHNWPTNDEEPDAAKFMFKFHSRPAK